MGSMRVALGASQRGHAAPFPTPPRYGHLGYPPKGEAGTPALLVRVGWSQAATARLAG